MATAEAGRTDGIEVVAIVTPNDVHVGPAIAFAQAGIDVICEKPLTDTMERALELEQVIKNSKVEFILTHNYTGYPLVRQARQLVEEGLLGDLRQVRVEYLQDVLIVNKKKPRNVWRGNPERCGPAGSVADIGSHAYHMVRFITGVDAHSLAADLATHTSGRILDDHAETLLRYANGAKGSLSISQVSTGKKCDLNVHIYGTKASIHWGQEDPNEMLYCELGKPKQVFQRGTSYLGEYATPESNIAPGHTEGYYEAFAQIYRDAHSLIVARREGHQIPETARRLAPNIHDGVAIARYINATIQSAQQNSAWVELASIGT